MKWMRLGGSVVLLALMAALPAAGCGSDSRYDGRDVGGACDSNRDCYDICLRGGDYPRGTCSRECSHDGHCPVDTACVNKHGGVCLLLCDSRLDCRPDYNCKSENRRGAPGSSPVCIK